MAYCNRYTCWLAYATGWLPCKVLLFISLVFLPGIALLRVMRVTLRTLPAGLLYGFGLSILILMLSGLAANQLLPLFNVERPLEAGGLLVILNIVILSCIIVGRVINVQPIQIEKVLPWTVLSKSAWLALLISFLLPCCAVAGAFRLNNGGNALFALAALCLAAMLIAYMILRRRNLPDGLLAWLIFSIALTVLLMTSLRGWDIVGHDIEREFRVYTLTHLNAHWNIGLDRNPYNACLSITILPEVFARLLNISGLIVFKVILQIIFAVCPVVIYLLLRQYTSRLSALTGSLLFICYPTFINDSAMLTRQGVAYLFFALALLIMTNRVQKERYKLIFMFCSLGAILSHYSTAYVFVALFIIAVICKLYVSQRQRRRHMPAMRHTVLSPMFVGILFLMTFVWYAQITSTSSGVMTTLRVSLANIPAMFSADNKSSDTSAALLFAGGRTQVDLYESYLRKSQTGGTPIGAESQEIAHLTEDSLPLTALGRRAQSIGANPSFITSFRQDFARFLQLLAIAGVLFVVYRLFRQKPDALAIDFVCISVAGIVLLVLLVALPILSINYGILRAFHQVMIFLLLPIVLVLGWASTVIRPSVRSGGAATAIVFLFLMFTGAFAQVLGGVGPHLSMNNHGLYYGLYYSPEVDKRAFMWLKDSVPADNDVRAANFNRAFMHDPDYSFSKTGILPSQIGPETYVYLDPAQVTHQKVYAHYDNSPLIIALPLDYYDQTKDRIYSTTSTGIYR